MESTHVVGILFYLTSGLLGATFYYPLKKVRGWAWESYWLIYAITALLIVPWLLAFTFVPSVLKILSETQFGVLAGCFGFGAMWGIGGLTWGLGIRYLGFGLGLALACGSCAAFGTLLPPLVAGRFPELLSTTHGIVTLCGVAFSLLGIVATGFAGMSKERELSAEQKKAAVPEFNFRKGAFLAIFAGFMSAGMSFGFRAGDSIKETAKNLGLQPDQFWEGLPVLVVVLLGGFAVNFLWCARLNAKNKTAGDYVRVRLSLIPNYILAILAGAIWYSQMLFFTAGDTKMGEFAKYASGWSVQMSSQIIFSTLLGLALGEWRGVSSRTKKRVALGLLLLIAAVAVIGLGKYLEPPAKPGN